MNEQTQTVTLLFTDLVNSTELLQRAGDEAAQRTLRAHHRLLGEAVAQHGGHEVKWLGDGLMVAFTSAASAVRCAIAVQQASRRPAAGERLRIRVGLNVGEALRDESDYYGTPVVIARRLCDRADAGQILASDLVAQLLESRREFRWDALGALSLKGIERAVGTSQVQYQADPLAMLTRAPFVGRAAEVNVLERRLAEARAGRGSAVMLAGEPGIGKTRLAEEISAVARDQGACVLWGRCYEGEWAPPFSPFVEAIRAHVASVSPEDLRGDLAGDAGVLARLVPELRESLSDIQEPPPLQPDSERFRLLDAIAAVFVTLAARTPVVLILDDLHWADGGSIAVMRHLSHAVAAQPILMLGTYRDVEVGAHHPLAAAVADMRRQPNFERIDLHGLGAEAVSELLDLVAEREVPEALVDAIVRETSGNPFFIREVLLHLIEAGKVVHLDGQWTASMTVEDMRIPDSVRDVVHRRLSRLSEPANEMLSVGSALSGGFTWDLLRAVHARATAPSVADHARLLDALDEALGAQLIVERARGTFDFSHALVRHTLYEAMSSPRRALLHGQIAETVEELYASDLDAHLSELAEHFCRAAAGGDVRRGVNYACRAAERAMAIAAHEECLRLSELALRTFELDAQRDPVRRCQLVLAVAHARANVGDREAAVIAYDEAIEVARDAAQPELFAIAALGVGERAVSASVVDAQRVARLEEALEWLPPNDSALRVRLVASLTHALYYTRNWERMRALSGDAVEMAQRIGDAGATAAALNARHTALWGPRGLDERLEIARQIVEYARTARDLELEFEGSSWALVAHLESGNLAAVDAAVEALSELAERLRTPRARFNALLEHAVRAVMDGRFAEGEALAGRALAFGQRADPTNAIISFSVVMLTIRREQGRLGELLPAVQSFVQQYSAVPGWRSVLAYVYAECDRLDEASVEFETCAAGDFANFPEDANWITTMTLLSEVCFVLHDRRRGALLYDLLSPSAGLCGVVGEGSTWFGSTSRLLGLLTATLGEHKDTVRYFEKALTVNRAMNATPMVARTEYQFGRVLVELGREADRERAVALLEQARASADALGMPRLVAQCDDTLAAAGAVAASPRSAARASVDDQ